MKPRRKGQTNYAMVAAIAFSLFCWLGLFAVGADLGETGFELLRQPGILPSMEGAVLVALNAFGLLVLASFALTGAAVLVRTAHHDAHNGRRMSGRPR